MGLSAKYQYILLSTLTIVVMSVMIVVLVTTLAVPPLEDGGSPEGPPRPNYNDEGIQSFSHKTIGNGDFIQHGKEVKKDHQKSLHEKLRSDIKHILPPIPPYDHGKDANKIQHNFEKDNSKYNLHPEKGKEADELLVTTAEPEPSSPFRQFRYAAVAADADPCNTIGTEILAAKQGSAVDAAIAVMTCVGLVHCHNSGIGGGHFMTIYEVPNDGSTEKVFNTILARERAPLDASRDMFVNTTDSSTKGGMSIAVPGEVRGFYKAWQKFGRVPWGDLIQPSIDLCVDGHLVSEPLAGAIRSYEDDIRNDPNLSELFVKEDGSIVEEGDILFRPKMAATLEIIANDPEAFYNPESQLAQDIIADIQEYDGIISLDDLAIYDIYDKDPLQITLDNGAYTVIGPRPPSSGAVFQYMLNVLDGYEFSSDDLTEPEQKTLTYHRIAEAYKFAYARRSDLGDEDFVDGIEEVIRNLTSSDYADATRALINDTHTQDVSYYGPSFDITVDHGTSHGNVFTADGSAVSITSTINLFFGSNVRGSRTGIFFNDEMDDFSTPGADNDFGVPPSPANYIVPYKMPMSSMCPTIVIDSEGEVRFLSGAAGGTRITTATAHVTMHTLWFDMRVDTATDSKRLHHQLMPHELRTEFGFDEVTLAGLAAKGHEMSSTSSLATVQSIHNTCSADDDTDCIHAVCDVRKSGIPDGY